MRTHTPLEIHDYQNDDYRFGYYSRGHHDDAAFLTACRTYHGGDLPVGIVEQAHWRTVTTGAGPFYIPAFAGRGSYPVTVYLFNDPE